MEQLWERLRESDPQDLPYIVRSSFIEASLSACRLANAARAKSIVTTVRRLQAPFVPPYLAAMLTWQESVSLRWEGNHNESDTVLDSIFRQLPKVPETDPDIRLHCAYGRLVFSRAENAILRNDFARAWQYVDHWESRNDPRSMMEIKLTRLFNTVFGRVARYTGNFLYARECFESCLQDGDPSYRHIQFHLADIYCELGHADLAKDLLLDDVERLRHTRSQQFKAFRRLALPLAEAYINLKELNAARYTLEEVLQVYESLKQHDVTDQLGHVRTLISLARVDWYEGMYISADGILKRATALVESYSTFITRGFDFAFITLFHSVVKRALARELLSEVPRGYFMAGNGTYFFAEISSSA
jgi:tetratricopeptide (TPR) repeat protein